MARLTVDATKNGVILEAHGDVLAMTGWEPDELAGQDITVVIPYKHREQHLAAFNRYATTGRKRAMGSWMPVECLHKSGELIPVMFVVTELGGILQAIMEVADDDNS